MDNLRLSIDLEKSIFIKNEDGTYYVMTAFDTGCMTFPKVEISFSAEAVYDESLSGFFKWTDYPERFAKIRSLLKKLFMFLKMLFSKRGKDIC